MQPKDRLIVALDVDTLARAMELMDILSPEVNIFKIGIAPFTDFGQILLDDAASRGKKIFLDLKFHDIPNTVRNAARAAARKGVFMMNFHCLGGSRMMAAALAGAEEGSGRGEKRPILLGVTILTSMQENDMVEIGIGGSVHDKVLRLAGLAERAGLDGVVASAKEARAIKRKIRNDFIVVTPGVRPSGSEAGDQKRVLTPAEAVSEGADYVVVGRPIIEAKDPAAAARKIIGEMKG
ncbi:MAG: orotidine-5'-phosphate decarboxylase [Candidatus Omnitrophota bacterium]